MLKIGNRKHRRIDLRKPGFLILQPDGPWVQCLITDISQSGVCIEVGQLTIPEVFVLVLTTSGSVRRICQRMWRRGELVGARFVTTKKLRDGLPQFAEPALHRG
jgi:hypothetical protein